MKFRVELRDINFVVKEILDNEAIDLRWAYSTVGGCGEFSFRLPRKRLEEKALKGDYNIRLYYRNPSTNSHDLWYQGLIENKVPTVRGNSESIEVSGHGYAVQLRRVYLNNITYTGQEVSVIVKDLLDNYIIPDTDITYSASDIEATSVTLDSIQFNETADSAIQKLADLVAPSREWGVDRNRSFFFKAKSTVVGHRYFTGGPYITNFQDNQDFTEIINRVIIQGSQTGGTYFTAGPYNDLPSQSKYNIRTVIKQNSSIVTTAVAQQFATAIFAEFNDVTRKASCELVGIESLVEATNPVPLFMEISRKIKYGQKKYGTFLYSGTVSRKINRINYSFSNNASLKIGLELGQLRPMLSEQIAGLEYQLEQQRSAAL